MSLTLGKRKSKLSTNLPLGRFESQISAYRLHSRLATSLSWLLSKPTRSRKKKVPLAARRERKLRSQNSKLKNPLEHHLSS